MSDTDSDATVMEDDSQAMADSVSDLEKVSSLDSDDIY